MDSIADWEKTGLLDFNWKKYIPFRTLGSCFFNWFSLYRLAKNTWEFEPRVLRGVYWKPLEVDADVTVPYALLPMRHASAVQFSTPASFRYLGDQTRRESGQSRNLRHAQLALHALLKLYSLPRNLLSIPESLSTFLPHKGVFLAHSSRAFNYSISRLKFIDGSDIYSRSGSP